MGRRGGRRGSQGRGAQGRVRERVRGGGTRRGGGGSTGRKQGGFDVGAVQDLASRLADRPGGGSGGGSGFSGGGSGLAGAAAGLASGGLAGRFLGGGSEGSDQDFRNEVADQFALVEERLQALEDQIQELRGMLEGSEASTETSTQDPTEPEGGGDAGSY